MKYHNRDKQKTYKISIYSDNSLNSIHKYTINHDSNILFISEIFKTHSIGTVHSLFINHNSPFIEATVSFKSNVVIHPLKKAGLFFKTPVLIPSTNVYIQIL